MTDFLIRPSINNKSLFKFKNSIDENGKKTIIPIIEEKPLTLYLNNQEIVTMMTIGDYPEYLALGYPYNQGMLSDISKYISRGFPFLYISLICLSVLRYINFISLFNNWGIPQ